jgi:hypothetical protein
MNSAKTSDLAPPLIVDARMWKKLPMREAIAQVFWSRAKIDVGIPALNNAGTHYGLHFDFLEEVRHRLSGPERTGHHEEHVRALKCSEVSKVSLRPNHLLQRRTSAKAGGKWSLPAFPVGDFEEPVSCYSYLGNLMESAFELERLVTANKALIRFAHRSPLL